MDIIFSKNRIVLKLIIAFILAVIVLLISIAVHIARQSPSPEIIKTISQTPTIINTPTLFVPTITPAPTIVTTKTITINLIPDPVSKSIPHEITIPSKAIIRPLIDSLDPSTIEASGFIIKEEGEYSLIITFNPGAQNSKYEHLTTLIDQSLYRFNTVNVNEWTYTSNVNRTSPCPQGKDEVQPPCGPAGIIIPNSSLFAECSVSASIYLNECDDIVKSIVATSPASIPPIFTIDDGYGSPTRRYSVLVEEGTKIEKYNKNNLFTMISSADPIKGFDLLLSVSGDYWPQAYVEVTDLKPEAYYNHLYRVKLISNPAYWLYTTNDPFLKPECRTSSGGILYSPCGLTYIVTAKISDTQSNIYSAQCTPKTDLGLQECDKVIKSIRELK